MKPHSIFKLLLTVYLFCLFGGKSWCSAWIEPTDPSIQGPSAPFGRWKVGRLMSDVSAKRQLRSHGVGLSAPHHRPKIPRLLRGWRTGSVGEIFQPMKKQWSHKIPSILIKCIWTCLLYLSDDLDLDAFWSLDVIVYFVKGCCFWSLDVIVYFVKGCCSVTAFTMICDREIDKLSTLPSRLNSTIYGASKL